MSFLGEKVFPASLDVLEEIRDYVLAAASGTKLDKKKIYKLQLAVDEIATNIVSYGYQQHKDHTGKIYIDAEFREQSLIVYLRDRGTAFDPRTKFRSEKETLTTSAEERRIGGLGIYLAMTGVDRFDYEYKEGMNINIFEVYINDDQVAKKSC